MTIQYIAGYFDGEGCVGVRVTKRQRKAVTSFPWAINPAITIGSYDYGVQQEIQDFLKEHMTAGLSFNSLKPRANQTKIEQRITLSGWDSAEKFARMILPYSIGKKPQLEYFLEITELRKTWYMTAQKHKNHQPLMTKEWFLKFILIIDKLNGFKNGKRGKYNMKFFS